jgi:hypothetical protein
VMEFHRYAELIMKRSKTLFQAGYIGLLITQVFSRKNPCG